MDTVTRRTFDGAVWAILLSGASGHADDKKDGEEEYDSTCEERPEEGEVKHGYLLPGLEIVHAAYQVVEGRAMPRVLTTRTKPRGRMLREEPSFCPVAAP